MDDAKYQIEKYGFFLMHSDVLGEEVLIKVKDDVSLSNENVFNRVKDAPRYTFKEAEMLIGMSEEDLRAIHMVKVKINGTITRHELENLSISPNAFGFG